MTELTTGYLSFEQLEAEVLSIVDDLKSFAIGTVYLTFGCGSQADASVQWQDIPVPVDRLAAFVAESEDTGLFELGEADLFIRAEGLEFLLCHERDIHCSGEESPRLAAVRRRWARDYEFSNEKRSGGPWRRLTGRPKDPRRG
jgi:hypothetical protein